MKRASIVLVAGWARPPCALTELAGRLRQRHDVRLTSPSDLLCLHGPATPDEAPQPFPSPYARALRKMLSDAGRPIVLAAWSMGGLIALESLAGDDSTVEGLALIGSTARLCTERDYACGTATAALRAMQQAVRQTPVPALARFLEAVHAPAAVEPAALLAEARESLAPGLDVLMHGLSYMAAADFRETLEALRVPTVILHGAQDQIIPCAAGEYLARHIAGSHLRVDASGGHDLPLARPGEVAQNLLDFIDGRVP